MVGLVIATVRQVSGSGCEKLAFDFMPSRSKVEPNVSQQPFEVKQQSKNSVQREGSSFLKASAPCLA